MSELPPSYGHFIYRSNISAYLSVQAEISEIGTYDDIFRDSDCQKTKTKTFRKSRTPRLPQFAQHETCHRFHVITMEKIANHLELFRTKLRFFWTEVWKLF